jgi:hypothetical protein
MARRNGAWWRRQDAARMFDEVVGAAAVSRYGRPAGWDLAALRHDIQVMAEVEALRYCAVEAVREGAAREGAVRDEEVVAIWLPSMGDGGVRTAEPAQPPAADSAHYTLRFVVYLRKDLTPYAGRLVFRWEPWQCRPMRRSAGWVEIMPGRTGFGKIGLSDGRCAALPPQDADGLAKDDRVECVVTRDDDTDALTAFLVSKAGAAAGTTVSGWIPKPRAEEAPAGVVVGGEVLLHRAGAEGCPACRAGARRRLLGPVIAEMRTLPAKIAVGLITSVIVSVLSSLAVVLAR